ncbi:tetratricopeptide repeat protein, partial [Candidatus Heimdallarchaeota archaeon]
MIISDEIEDLMLNGKFLDVLELLEELKTNSTLSLFDELELTSLQLLSQRHLRNYTKLAPYFDKLSKLYEKIKLQYPEAKEMRNLFNEFIEKKITFIIFTDSIKSLSSGIKERFPLIIYTEIQSQIRAKSNFFFPLKHDDFLKFFNLFQEYKGYIFYAELHVNAAWSHLYKWENKIALNLAFDFQKKAQDKNDAYGMVISHATIAGVYADMGNSREAIDHSFEYLKLAKRLGITNVIWHAYFSLALNHTYADDIVNSKKYDLICSELEEQPDFTDTLTKSSRKLVEVHLNVKAGDIDLALAQLLKILEKPNTLMNNYTLGIAYELISGIYIQKNEYDNALEYTNKSLEIREEFGGRAILAVNYFHIIEIYLTLEKETEAFKYFEKLRKLNEETDELLINNLYLFSKALLLKSEKTSESKEKAKKILVDIISAETPFYHTTDKSYLYLCDILLEEVRVSENMALIATLQNYIKELTLKATFANSNLLIIELYFLQSKLLLLDLKVEEAINVLEQALTLARDKGLVRLEILLSNEYDLLLLQLDKWEEFTSYLPTIDERMELTHVEDLVTKMMRKWIPYGSIIPEKESPQFFIILSKEGMNIFSESFSDVVFDKAVIGDILVKIKSLANELIPNQEPKRFRFRQHSCLLTQVEDLLFC